MAIHFKSKMSYKVLTELCSHIFDESLDEEEIDKISSMFKSRGGNWESITHGDPHQMQMLISSLRSYMKTERDMKKKKERSGGDR